MNKLKIDMIFKSGLIFCGIVLMQLLAYMICFGGGIAVYIARGENYISAAYKMSQMRDTGSFLIWISAVSASLSFIWCAILYRKSSWRVKGIDYKKVFCKKNVLSIICVAVGGCIIITFAMTFISNLFPKMFEGYTKLMSNFDVDSFGMTIIYVLLIGPVSEEIIFRGAMFDRFHIGFSFWTANALQAFFFGLYHMNLIQGCYAFILGMALGMVVYSTGSIICSIMTHILFNTTTYVLPAALGVKSALLRNAVVIFLIIMAVLSLIAVRYFVKISNEKIQKDERRYNG